VSVEQLLLIVAVGLLIALLGGVGRRSDAPLPVDQASLQTLVTQLTHLQADNERLAARVRELEYQLADCLRSGRGPQAGMGMVNR